MEKYIIIAIIGAMLSSIIPIIQKRAQGIDSITLTFTSIGTSFFCILIYWFFFNNSKEYSVKGISSGIIAGIIFAITFLLFIIALRLGKASIVVVINSLSIVLTVILSMVFLSESLTIKQFIGIVLGMISIILLTL